MVPVMSNKKFLLLRFSSIGDILLTTPIVRCLKNAYPESEIIYLTKKNYLPLLEGNPYIDRLIGIQNNVFEIKKLLKQQKPDEIIDLHKNLRTWQVRLMNFDSKYSTFNKINLKKWLAVRFKKLSILPDIHVVDRYFEAVRHLNVVYDGQGLDYFFKDKNVNVSGLPQKYVVWVVGAKFATKAVPVEKSAEIIAALSFPVVLIGGKEDIPKSQLIMNKLKNYEVYDFCGKTDFDESAYIIEHSIGVITPDTGMMHMAAALKKKIVVIWGNTVPQFGMYPLLPNDLKHYYLPFEVNHLSCRPCSKLGFEKCPKSHFKCMNDHDARMIAKKAKSQFGLMN